jgi:uncharacterized protein
LKGFREKDMRILVVSDTHGNVKSVLRYIEKAEAFDMMVHLGDYTDDGRTISAMTGIKAVIVKGNGDYGDEKYLDEEILELGSKKVLITHGHGYGVKRDLGSLFYRAKELDVDAVLFGHTHIALSIEHEGVALFNPGSASEPRLGAKPTIGVITVSGDSGEVLEKNIIDL